LKCHLETNADLHARPYFFVAFTQSSRHIGQAALAKAFSCHDRIGTAADRDPLGYLFRGLSIEVFAVGLCIAACKVNDAVAMIRRRVQRVELQGDGAGVDDVVGGVRISVCEALD
jgi:hypothetical protein